MPLRLSVPGLSLAPISSCFLASAPFLSQSVCESSSHSPALAWAEGSMSDRASYCNHWPVPQPPFGPWPPFPQVWECSFISAEPGPRGHNDSSSLGLHLLSQLKLLKSWLILLLLLLWLHTVGITASLAEYTRQEHGKLHSPQDVDVILIPLNCHCVGDRHTMHSWLTRRFV